MNMGKEEFRSPVDVFEEHPGVCIEDGKALIVAWVFGNDAIDAVENIDQDDDELAIRIKLRVSTAVDKLIDDNEFPPSGSKILSEEKKQLIYALRKDLAEAIEKIDSIKYR